MTATFDQTLPTAMDRLRRALGDANVANALRQDEEYAAVLARLEDNETAALVEMASGLASEYAQKPDSISDEDGAITWRERVKTWLALATAGRAELSAAATAASNAASSIAVRRAHDYRRSEYRRPHRWAGWECD